MVKKNPSAAASSTSGGAAAKSSSILSKEGAPLLPQPGAGATNFISQAQRLDSFNPTEETRAPPMKRSISGFADEDDLLDIFLECALPNDLYKTFPFFKDLRGVISSLEAFASQFTSLEADKIRLQEEAKSSSSKLDGAIKKAAIARQEVDSLKEELSKLKERLKEEKLGQQKRMNSFVILP
ncbi:hypothetical protein QYE76_006669 [Lolium multiflorum]|uniref:Uncharacterized protein n=1 Tax=Lolium multiflorum TaxID=4521 RepID=A0AAD8RX87_LOLMU|nr:hypothetical protein QYE76_006669 [Lolium multiflorum]